MLNDRIRNFNFNEGVNVLLELHMRRYDCIAQINSKIWDM